MTKRPLYAAVEAAVSLAALLTVLPRPAHAAAPRPQGECAACVAIAIDPDAALSLPAGLEGMDVFVRTTRGAEFLVLPALIEIERRGGRPSLLIPTPTVALPSEVAQHVHRIVVGAGPSSVGQSDDQFAFSLKTSLTALRATVSDSTLLGLSGSGHQLSFLATRDLMSYVDFVVVSDATPFEASGVEQWRLMTEAATLDRVLRTTRSGSASRLIWMLPGDAASAGSLAGELARVTAAPSSATLHGAGEAFSQDVQVVGARSLTVEEIIARHQAVVARQSAAVQSVIADGTLTLSFEAPGFPAPITISANVTMYALAGVTEIEQREVRINGVEFRGASIPRLPIIEPERVASPPLAIALTDVYRYRLEGRDTIGQTRCYIVSFEPDPARADKTSSLFRGRAWIAADSFAMLKVAATQTALRGAIVASEQIDEFRQARNGVWLLGRSDVRQMYEGAAHRTPIHRVLVIEADAINAGDFAERRQHAYNSASVMLRDTPEGYRYLKKESASRPETPSIAGRSDRVRTIAAGVIVDPNISTPLPFAGFSYVDFNFLGSGTQINAFFGGTYGQFAFSMPSLRRSRWQLAGSAFGIATPFNDRSFVNGREQYDQNLEQRPAQASIWVLHPLTARVSFRVGYDLDYTQLSVGHTTSPSFVVPADQVVHGARFSLDAQHAGWNASLWWNPAHRLGWRPWGQPGSTDYDPSHAGFQRYGASIVRSHVVNPRVVTRLEAAWMSGEDLDRFSRYAFGTFDNRLRGYPSALIRYDRGGVLRTAVAWSVNRLVRMDGFVDSAAVHDPGFGSGLRNYTGVGGAVEVPAAFGTLLALEWGYGFRGVNSDGTLGTQVFRVSGYKVF